MSRIPTKGIDYTSKDYESFRTDMIKNLKIKMPEYTDTRQSDAGIVILELLAQGLDVISYYQDVIANEAFLVTAEQRNNVLKWCQMLNYIPKASTPAIFEQVFVLNAVQKTDTLIPAGTKVKTVNTVAEPSVYFETKEDLIIPAGKLGNEKSGNKYLYSVEVVQGVTITGELLGSSSGAKDQSFKLNYTPALLNSISVLINEGSGFEKWNRVDNFVDSTPTSKDFTVTITANDEAIITFGDGVFGKIPGEYVNGMYCNYRIGGGVQGNVGANKITVVDSPLALVKETYNPSTAHREGQDKETLEEIKRNAPVSFRTVWGALTERDFAEVTLSNVLEIQDAASYVVGDGTDIDIYAKPKHDAPLSAELKTKISDLFDPNKGGRKIVGSNTITVKEYKKRAVNITAILGVSTRYDYDHIVEKLRALLKVYFSTFTFNQELSVSSLTSFIMNPNNGIEGLRYCKITVPSENVLVPAPGEIFTFGTLSASNGG